MQDFRAIRAQENDYIKQSRKRRLGEAEEELYTLTNQLIGAKNEDPPLTGLAVSGGGIRSATFALGAIQALAKRRYLHQFDYMSTVSGGGYCGAWLIAWALRAGGIKTVEDALTELPKGTDIEDPAAGRGDSTREKQRGPEPEEVAELRAYSNYLTPSLNVVGSDPWTFAAAYVLNLAINLVVIGLLISFTLYTPIVVMLGLVTMPRTACLGLGGVLLLIFVGSIGFSTVQRNRGKTSFDIPSENTFPHVTMLACYYVGVLTIGIQAQSVKAFLAPPPTGLIVNSHDICNGVASMPFLLSQSPRPSL